MFYVILSYLCLFGLTLAASFNIRNQDGFFNNFEYHLFNDDYHYYMLKSFLLSLNISELACI